MRVAVFWMTLLCLSSTIVAAQSLDAGQMSVTYHGNKGAHVDFAGVPVIRATSLQFYAPAWTQTYYTNDSDHVQPRFESGKITIARHAKKLPFAPVETIRAAGDNRLEISIAGQLDGTADAHMEWCVGLINTFALYGGSISPLTSDALRPIAPEPAEKRGELALLRNVPGVRITTRLGRIDVKVERGPGTLNVLDGRRDPAKSWELEQPTLWLGMTGVAIKPREPFEFVVSIEFHPNPPRELAQPIIGDAPAHAVERAFVPESRPVQIIPRPRSLKWAGGEPFRIAGQLTAGPDQADTHRAIESLRQQLDQRFAVKVSAADGAAQVSLTIDSSQKPPPESYVLHVDSRGIAMTAGDAVGLFYGVQTLTQMLQFDDHGLFIPAADISDEPSLQFRGVHLFTGRDSVPFFANLATNVLAHFKFNHVVIESEYAQWDSAKNIWFAQSVPKAQIADYVKIARDHFLEPIPLVQSLGHSEWMFRNHQNTDLAEDPDHPYAYDVTNPKTYDFIRAVYAEAMQLFDKPEYFHIGHDEVAITARYPYREASKKLGETQLFIDDVNAHEKFFAPQGTKLMLWGDMLLHRRSETNDNAGNAPSDVEARKRRDAMPRDAVICDWHYQPARPRDYKSLKIFHDEGFKTLACTWYQPDNIANFAQAARLYQSWGLLQTTWAGYHLSKDTVDREMRQFAAYILAAEYAWSSDSPAPADLPWRAEEVFARAINPQRQPITPRAGTQIDLSKFANMKLDQWMGFASCSLADLTSNDRIAGFSLAPSPQGAIALAGALLPRDLKAPKSITLTTSIPRAAELAFLHATACPAPLGETIATYTITYADHSTETIPLRYGREIRAWTDLAATSGASTGWFAKAKNNLPAAVRVLRWTNPHPDRAISSINFATDHAYASPALFGVTAIQ